MAQQGNSELFRQRMFMENYLANLKKHIDAIGPKKDTTEKMLEENRKLIAEANKLKKESKINQTMYNDLAEILGIDDQKYFSTLQYKNKIDKAVAQISAVEKEYIDELNVSILFLFVFPIKIFTIFNDVFRN